MKCTPIDAEMCTGKALLNSGVEIRLFTGLVSNYIVTMPAHTSQGFHIDFYKPQVQDNVKAFKTSLA